jgi:hypothetical protein
MDSGELTPASKRWNNNNDWFSDIDSDDLNAVITPTIASLNNIGNRKINIIVDSQPKALFQSDEYSSEKKPAPRSMVMTSNRVNYLQPKSNLYNITEESSNLSRSRSSNILLNEMEEESKVISRHSDTNISPMVQGFEQMQGLMKCVIQPYQVRITKFNLIDDDKWFAKAEWIQNSTHREAVPGSKEVLHSWLRQ